MNPKFYKYRKTNLELIRCCRRNDLTTGLLSIPNLGNGEKGFVPSNSSPTHIAWAFQTLPDPASDYLLRNKILKWYRQRTRCSAEETLRDLPGCLCRWQMLDYRRCYVGKLDFSKMWMGQDGNRVAISKCRICNLYCHDFIKVSI